MIESGRCITLLTNIKGLGCTANISQMLDLQPNISLKTHFQACFNNHVTSGSHVTHKIDECPTAYIEQ